MTESPERGAIVFPHADVVWEECSTQEILHLQCGRGTKHQNPVICPFNSVPKTTKLSLSSYNSNTLYPPSFGSQGDGCKWNFVSWSFKRAPGFLADSCLFMEDRIPTDFQRQTLFGCFFLALVLWAGEPYLGLRLQLFRWNLCSWDIPLKFHLLLVGVELAILTSAAFINLWL